MALLDVFKRKDTKKSESNSLFGQTTLGNNIFWAGNKQSPSSTQVLYVTTGSTNTAGTPVDMSLLTRNSTILSCVALKARALSQLPIKIMSKSDDGNFVNAIQSDSVGPRDKAKAKQVAALLAQPNQFQSPYEFWFQWLLWYELSGEAFTVWWRKDQASSTETPLEMYLFDSTLITTIITPTRYPSYQLSTPTFGFISQIFAAHQVMHCKEIPWQGSAGFNKGILAAELVTLDQSIDWYANYTMANGAKPSGMFTTEQVIADSKYKEIAGRLKEAWSNMTNSKQSDPSKPGQGMLLDQGMKYTPLEMLTLQDSDCAALKEQTMKRICALFGVPAQMLGIGEGKFNNTQTLLDEFYKSTIYPTLINVQQKLKQALFPGYPNLFIEFDTADFLKGAPLDQMNYIVAATGAGIMTPNEAREYVGMAKIDGGDELKSTDTPKPIMGTSPQDTGGGGGNQTKKMNIGK